MPVADIEQDTGTLSFTLSMNELLSAETILEDNTNAERKVAVMRLRTTLY